MIVCRWLDLTSTRVHAEGRKSLGLKGAVVVFSDASAALGVGTDSGEMKIIGFFARKS